MFAQWKKLLVKLFNKPSDDRGITDEELMTIVEEAEQEGGIDADESTLIRYFSSSLFPGIGAQTAK